jgi:hypothetical protein
MAIGAPIIQDPLLHEDFGYLVDKNATDKVLTGSYVYTDGMDALTWLLLEEAHLVFSSLLEEEVIYFVTTTDFQSYWSYAYEEIQLLESGCHFGHYKVASHDKYLTALHCVKLTLVAMTGIPLARWGHGLTFLLEKVLRNIYIDKMRALCLLEAIYNWLNKHVFAKQMMDKALLEGIIPIEQFAKQGSEASHGVLASGLLCDIACTLHKRSAIKSVDLANCYHADTHPIASIALQGFKVRKVMVAMILYVLETKQ